MANNTIFTIGLSKDHKPMEKWVLNVVDKLENFGLNWFEPVISITSIIQLSVSFYKITVIRATRIPMFETILFALSLLKICISRLKIDEF